MKWIPAALALVSLGAAPAAQAPDPVWKSWKEITSNAGHYRVRYQFEKEPPPRGELFALQAYVLDAAGKEVRAKVALLADADMPEHGHGLARAPEVQHEKDGGFAIRGMRLPMPGKWQLYFDVVEGFHTERAQLDLVLE